MANVGNTATPTIGFICRGDGTNQVWSPFTMPSPGGWIIQVHAYFGAFTGSATGQACIWGSGGSLLGNGSVGTVNTQSCAAGSQTFLGAVLNTPVYVNAGATINLGFWMPSANGFSTSSESGGSSFMKAAGSSPSNLSSPVSTGIGALGVFGVYTPNLLKIRRSGAWVELPLNVRRSGLWTPVTPLYIRRSGAWVQIQ